MFVQCGMLRQVWERRGLGAMGRMTFRNPLWRRPLLGCVVSDGWKSARPEGQWAAAPRAPGRVHGEGEAARVEPAKKLSSAPGSAVQGDRM